MSIEELLAIAIGIGCVIALAVVIRRVWSAVTNPEVAYQLGRRTRRMVEGAAHTAGRATGAAEGAAGVIGRSFRTGRDSAKSKDGAPEGDA